VAGAAVPDEEDNEYGTYGDESGTDSGDDYSVRS